MLDPRVRRLLDDLRSRIRRYVVIDSLLTFLAVLLAAFWLGLALDYLPVTVGGTEMPWTARLVGLVGLAVALGLIVVKMLLGRLHTSLPDDSLALLVERHHPNLGGRLVTTVQLSQTGRTGDTHSTDLLRYVHDEAAEKIDEVDPSRVFQQAPLFKKSMIAAPLFLATLALFVIRPDSFARAASRLTLFSDDPWPRRAQLEMVGVELPAVTANGDESIEPQKLTFDENRTLRLPRGSNGAMRIRARADEPFELPVVCTVRYKIIPRDDSGTTENAATSGQSNMRRVGRVVEGYQSFLLDGPPLASLSDSIIFHVRGLDDRLSDYRIEAVDPPAMTQMQVAFRYPDYLRGAPADDMGFDRIEGYQSGLRLPQGSSVTLIGTSSLPLGEADVMVTSTSDQPVPFQTHYAESRRKLRIEIQDFDSALTVHVVPRDASGISAQAPFRYFLGAVTDQPPEIKLRLVGIGTAVTPIARLPVAMQATDDYGIDTLTVSLTPSTTEGTSKSAQTSPPRDRQGKASSVLDLRDLIASGDLDALSPGHAINVLGEVTDHYDLDGKHITRSEIYRLEIVTPADLLALLERRELGLRSRLEQTISEARSLRDTLSLLGRSLGEFDSSENATPPNSQENDADAEATRRSQVHRLRTQQCRLQANKTSEELTGIAESLDDLLREMINNRVDSVDRRQRIGSGVRDPLKNIVTGSLAQLQQEIQSIEKQLDTTPQAIEATRRTIGTSETVLLELTAVLEKMLDLESYNEILDMVRGLIDDQEKLLEDTQRERKKRVLDLFQ